MLVVGCTDGRIVEDGDNPFEDLVPRSGEVDPGEGNSSSPSTSTDEATPRDGDEGPGSSSVDEAETEPEVVLAPRFTRLTRLEYAETLQSAFGFVPSLAGIPDDGRVGPYTSNASVTPDPVHPYLILAEQLAADLVPETLPACEADDALSCFEENYESPLERLYRRPLREGEAERWAELLVAAQEEGVSSVEASRAVWTAALVSPSFLFHSMPSPGAGSQHRRQRSEWLSYTLWDRPSAQDSSEDDTGGRAQALEAQAVAMMQDPRSVPVMARFVAQWLHVDTDHRREDAGFEKSADFVEYLRFVEEALASDLPITELLSSGQGFVHEDNAELYGMALEGEVEDGEDASVQAVEWPTDSGRRGLLAQELFSGSTRHPDVSRRRIFRGLLVRRSLLCSEIPAPNPELLALAGEVSDRATDPRCRGCHERMDPIGQSFAAFDPGRDADEDVPPAVVLHHDELEGTYSNVGHLLEAIADSRAFAECFAQHWLSFFLERERSELEPSLTEPLAALIQSGASLATLAGETARQLEEAPEPPLLCEVRQ